MKSFQAYIFSEFIHCHHKIRVSIGLVAEEILVQNWIFKLNRNDVYKTQKSLYVVYDTDNPD